MPPAFNLSQDQTLQFKPVTVFGSFEPVAHSKLTGHMNCFINLTYFSVRLLILLLSRSEDQVSLTSSAHTYRLLVFKEHVCEQIVLLSSAALSAAEKRDYEHCFAARQQLFSLHRCDCGVLLPSSPTRSTLQHTADSASPLAPRFR